MIFWFQNLVSGATACSYRDLITLKLILVSGLYPQIAIPDEFNHLKVGHVILREN